MEISIIRKPELVVAVDFGSTYSGYAWQWRADFLNNRSNVQFNSNWGSGAPQLNKTSTCILLEANEKDGVMEYKIDSFGQMAEDIYKTLCKENENDIPGKWYLFKRFKHLLYSKGFHQDIQVEDQIGQHLPLLDVVAKFIEALKNHFIINLEQKGQHVEMDKILWVVTVPTIWCNDAKAFMRQAAKMGGIKTKNLFLELEPEAAAIYCIQLLKKQRANTNELGAPGQVFLIADIGELTADVSAIRVLENGILDEMQVSRAELPCGQNVNDAFFQVCLDSFEGDSGKHIFGKAKPTQIMDMEDDPDQKKGRIGFTDPRTEYRALKVPFAVRKEIEKNAIRLKSTAGIDKKLKRKDDEFTFHSKFIRDTHFKESCLKICNIMERELKQDGLRECKTIVLVGGFAESPIAVKHIRTIIEKSFPEIRFIVPTSPVQAVMNGAVLHGHDPVILLSRESTFTYSVGQNSRINNKTHEVNKKLPSGENNQYGDISATHVERGDPVVQEEKLEQLLYKGQKNVKLAMHTSTNVGNIMYKTNERSQKREKVMHSQDTASDADMDLFYVLPFLVI